MGFQIFTDSAANLPTPFAKEHNIGVLCLSYCMEGKSYQCPDTEDFDYPAYYEAMMNGPVITTSQVTPEQYMEQLEPVLAAGEDVLFVSLSSGISGCYASGCMAREQLLEKYPQRQIVMVDSMGAGMGEGILVTKALEYRAQGMTAREAGEKLEALKKNLCQIFSVDDLMYLKKGGRLSGASALLGSVLNIKPLLKGSAEGKIVPFGKVRGRKALLNRLAEIYRERVVNPGEQIVAISHCHCPEDAQYLKEQILSAHPPRELWVVNHEPVTGSYLGKGGIALFFLGDEDVRNI